MSPLTVVLYTGDVMCIAVFADIAWRVRRSPQERESALFIALVLVAVLVCTWFIPPGGA
jgi:hypothetical protein